MIRFLIRTFYNWYYSKYPPEMVKYWKKSESARAKVMINEDGVAQMQIEGEKYAYPGFPRGHLLFGPLSEVKHVAKNVIFNDIWRKLEKKGLGVTDVDREFRRESDFIKKSNNLTEEAKKLRLDQEQRLYWLRRQDAIKFVEITPEEIIKDLKTRGLQELLMVSDLGKLDMMPPEKMAYPVREIWRAWGQLEKSHPRHARTLRRLKECLCFILQEDDAYKFRIQWIVQFFNPRSWWMKLWRFFTHRTIIDDFESALLKLEDAEIMGDMKGRMKLLRRVLLFLLSDKTIRSLFEELAKEINWNKLKLSKADKYYFRGKYFKVDHKYYEY